MSASLLEYLLSPDPTGSAPNIEGMGLSIVSYLVMDVPLEHQYRMALQVVVFILWITQSLPTRMKCGLGGAIGSAFNKF
jgi:hypothetical protein